MTFRILPPGNSLGRLVFSLAILAMAVTVAVPTARADHGDNSGRTYSFLEAGFTQDLFGIVPFVGGVAFAPDGDVWVDNCQGASGWLNRFDVQSTVPEVNGTDDLHPLGPAVQSDTGCAMTNHPNGFIYANNNARGVAEIDANTGVATGRFWGPAGNFNSITTDPITHDIVYGAQTCFDNSDGCTLSRSTLLLERRLLS